MAAPTVLTNATIWLGGYDLTASTNEVTFNAARQEKPVSRFGDTIEATYPGAQTVSAEVKGFWDSTLDGPQFTQLTAPSESWPLTVCPDGGDEGEVQYEIQAYSFNYSALEATWGASLPFRLAAKSKSGGRLDRGLVVLSKGTYALSAVSVSKHQLGAVSATQKIKATWHVFAIDGGDWKVWMQSDADAVAGGETTRFSIEGITTAPGRHTAEFAGPITDTYWQVTLVKDGGTSITCAVTLAIVDA